MQTKRPPTKSSPVLTEPSQQVFGRLDQTLGYPCVAYWTSTGGSICQNDVMAMAQLLKDQGRHQKLGLFIKSEGGNPEAALRLVHLLRHHFQRVVLFAPFECASAATMVALGADEIHMGPTSFLTAVDTSLKHDLSPVDSRNNLVSVSQDEVNRILRMWTEQKTGDNPYPEVYKYLHPLVIGSLDRSSSLSIRICKELLSYHMRDLKKAERISRELNSAYPSHSYPITAQEAAHLGLSIRPIDPDVENLLRELNQLYSTMSQSLVTDYDEFNNHSNEICNILERKGRQIYYQVDKDWHYRKDERRWVTMHDKSAWHGVEREGRRWVNRTFFIR
ncbi:MAG: hypothetical protein HY360_16740 [Verrucomicrobia bacterium]|nr:hypothetical protein [Verrucomicrobiota bacterium]